MNTRRFISFVLLVCVCLSVLFSPLHTVYAADSNTIVIDFTDDYTFVDPNEPMLLDDTIESNSCTYVSGVTFDGTTDWTYNLITGNKAIHDGTYDMVIWQDLGKTIFAGTYDITVTYTVNTDSQTLNACFFGPRTNSDGSLNSSFEANSIVYTKSSGDNLGYYIVQYNDVEITYDFERFRHKLNFTVVPSTIVFTEEDDTKGLLSSIIEWIKSIYEGIVNLPSKIANSLKTFFDNIVNAVVELGNTIIDGIKNLFIPTEEDITNMQDKWNTHLEDRFGALYHVIELIHDYAAAFTEQSKGTITFPSVTIPLGDADFVFGGWEVQVVPDGFSIVFDTLKIIISILATCLFANGLKNRFEKLVGGSDNI